MAEQEKTETEQTEHSSWSITKDIATIITPIVLLVGGALFQRALTADSAALTASLTQQKEDLEMTLEKMRDSREEAAQKIEQSKLLTTLMQSMLSQKPSERQLAINIALHACGEAGRQVVEAVSIDDSYASQQLNTVRKNLVEQLIAPDARKRWEAAEALGTTWGSDPGVLDDLRAFAKANTRTPLALYNTLVVMADLPGSAYIGKTEATRELMSLIQTAGPRGAKTDSLIRRVQQKLVAAETK